MKVSVNGREYGSLGRVLGFVVLAWLLMVLLVLGLMILMFLVRSA